ncbi:hypothetical protein Hanom_Chr04g00286711 [Helianthus anomalus]
MRNNATNVVEFANAVSEESQEKIAKSSYFDLQESLVQVETIPSDAIFMYAFRCDDVSVGYEVKKGDTVPYQPYTRVKFDEFEPEDGFITLLLSSRKLL